MAFPVDILTTVNYESLEQSSKDYMSKLLYPNSETPEYLTLPNSKKIEIGLCNVSFVPLHGTDIKHKILALFTLDDPFTAVGLYLQGQWWSVEDVLKTSDSTREGILKVKTVGERVVLYVLNRIVYRATEMSKDEVPFLCHSENDFAKIIWKNGEAIGFYSVKPEGSLCSNFLTQRYQLPVLDSMFVRKCHRGNGLGLQILEDFVDSFKNPCLGLKYPLSTALYKVCGKYLSTYPGDAGLLWEVESVGGPFQRTQISSKILDMGLKHQEAVNHDVSMEDLMTKMQETVEYTVEVVEKVMQIETHVPITKEVDDTPVSTRGRSSQLRRKRIREETSEVVEESMVDKVLRVEKIEAGNETPVEEPVSEKQREGGRDQDMEVEDVVSTVKETKIDQKDAEANELAQASDITATVIDEDGQEDIDTPIKVTEQHKDSSEQVSVDTVEPVLEITASEATSTELNDMEENADEYSTRKSPVEDVQREDEGEDSSQLMSDVSQLTVVEDVKMTSEVDEEEEVSPEKKLETSDEKLIEEVQESVAESESIPHLDTQTQGSAEAGDSGAERAPQKTQNDAESEGDTEDNAEKSTTIEKRILRKRTVVSTELPRAKIQQGGMKAVEESTAVPTDKKEKPAEEQVEEAKETAEESSDDEPSQTSQRLLRGRTKAVKATPKRKSTRRSTRKVAQTDSQPTTEAEEEADCQQGSSDEAVEKQPEMTALVEEKGSEEVDVEPTTAHKAEEEAEAESQATADESAQGKEEASVQKDLEPEEAAATEEKGNRDDCDENEKTTQLKDDGEQDVMELDVSDKEVVADETPIEELKADLTTSGNNDKGEIREDDETPQMEESQDMNEETVEVTEQSEKRVEDADTADAEVSQDEAGTTTQESSDHDMAVDEAEESPTVNKRVLRRRAVTSTETPKRKSQRGRKKAKDESTVMPSDEKTEPAPAGEKIEKAKETAESSDDEAPETSKRVLRGRTTAVKATPKREYTRRSTKKAAQTDSQPTTEAQEDAEKDGDSQQEITVENAEVSEMVTLMEEKDSQEVTETAEKTPADTAESESQLIADEATEEKESEAEKTVEEEVAGEIDGEITEKEVSTNDSNETENEATTESKDNTEEQEGMELEISSKEKQIEEDETAKDEEKADLTISEADDKGKTGEGETSPIEVGIDTNEKTVEVTEQTEERNKNVENAADVETSQNEAETTIHVPSGVADKGEPGEDETPQMEDGKDTNEETVEVTKVTEKQDEDVVNTADAEVSQDEAGTTTQESSDHDMGTDEAEESPSVGKRILRGRAVVGTETPKRKSQRGRKKAVEENIVTPSDEPAEEKIEKAADESSDDEASQTSQRVLRGRTKAVKTTPKRKSTKRSTRKTAPTDSQPTTEAEDEAEQDNDNQQEKDNILEKEPELATLDEEKDTEEVDTEQEVAQERTPADITETETQATTDESAEDKDETVHTEMEINKVNEGDAMAEEELKAAEKQEEDKQEMEEDVAQKGELTASVVAGDENTINQQSAKLIPDNDTVKDAEIDSEATEHQSIQATTDTISEGMEVGSVEKEVSSEEPETVEQTATTEITHTVETVDEGEKMSSENAEETGGIKLQKATVVLVDVNKISPRSELEVESADNKQGETGEDEDSTVENLDVTVPETDKQDVIEKDSLVSHDETQSQEGTDEAEEISTTGKRTLRSRAIVNIETPQRKSQRGQKKTVEEQVAKESAEESSDDETPETSQRVFRGKRKAVKGTTKRKSTRRGTRKTAQTDEELEEEHDEIQQPKETTEGREEEEAEAMVLEISSDEKGADIEEKAPEQEEIFDVPPAEDVATENNDAPVTSQEIEEGATNLVAENKTEEDSESTEQIGDLSNKEILPEEIKMTVDEGTAEEPSAGDSKNDSDELQLQKATVLLVDVTKTLPPLDLETENTDTPRAGEIFEIGDDQTPQTIEDKEEDKLDESVEATDSQASQEEMGTTTQESSDHEMVTDEAEESPSVEKRVLRKRAVVSTETPRRKSQRGRKKAVEESTVALSDEKVETAEEDMVGAKGTAEESSDDEAPETSQRILRGKTKAGKATPKLKSKRRSTRKAAQTDSQQTTEAEDEPEKDVSQQAENAALAVEKDIAEEEPKEENEPEQEKAGIPESEGHPEVQMADEVTTEEAEPDEELETVDNVVRQQDTLDENQIGEKKSTVNADATENLEETAISAHEEKPVEESVTEESEPIQLQKATVDLVDTNEGCSPSGVEMTNVEITPEPANSETKADDANLVEPETPDIEEAAPAAEEEATLIEDTESKEQSVTDDGNEKNSQTEEEKDEDIPVVETRSSRRRKAPAGHTPQRKLRRLDIKEKNEKSNPEETEEASAEVQEEKEDKSDENNGDLEEATEMAEKIASEVQSTSDTKTNTDEEEKQEEKQSEEKIEKEETVNEPEVSVLERESEMAPISSDPEESPTATKRAKGKPKRKRRAASSRRRQSKRVRKEEEESEEEEVEEAGSDAMAKSDEATPDEPVSQETEDKNMEPDDNSTEMTDQMPGITDSSEKPEEEQSASNKEELVSADEEVLNEEELLKNKTISDVLTLSEPKDAPEEQTEMTPDAEVHTETQEVVNVSTEVQDKVEEEEGEQPQEGNTLESSEEDHTSEKAPETEDSTEEEEDVLVLRGRSIIQTPKRSKRAIPKEQNDQAAGDKAPGTDDSTEEEEDVLELRGRSIIQTPKRSKRMGNDQKATVRTSNKNTRERTPQGKKAKVDVTPLRRSSRIK